MPKKRPLSSAAAEAMPKTPKPISCEEAGRLAAIVHWTRDRAVDDMLDLLFAVQGTASILRRPPEEAANKDFVAMRKLLQPTLEITSWIEQPAIHWALVNGYQARHVETPTTPNAAATLLASDWARLRRLASAVDFAIELTKPPRGARRIDPAAHIVVREAQPALFADACFTSPPGSATSKGSVSGSNSLGNSIP